MKKMMLLELLRCFLELPKGRRRVHVSLGLESSEEL